MKILVLEGDRVVAREIGDLARLENKIKTIEKRLNAIETRVIQLENTVRLKKATLIHSSSSSILEVEEESKNS